MRATPSTGITQHTSRRLGALATLFFTAITSSASAAATPVGPFQLEMNDREAVRRFFYAVHDASDGIAINWTGNLASCEPGTVSQDFLDATLTRINYFRAMAGVPSDITFSAENNARAQAAALIMSGRKGEKETLSHDPPQSWKCWTQAGHDGASANLSGGNTGPTAIDALVRDGTNVGHRRTLLNPRIMLMGSGSIPETAAGSAVEAQYMQDNPSDEPRPTRDEFVAWPPKGFVPHMLVPAAWSFSLLGADFSQANVSLQRPDGSAIGATITFRDDWAGPGLVWQVAGLSSSCQGQPQPCLETWPKVANDEPVNVTVSNVVVGGAAREFKYTVTVFDPALGDPAHTPLLISGPAQPPRNQPSSYRVNDIPNAIGYQWRVRKLTPFELTDGAENGFGNFDAVVGAYQPVSPNFVATGESAFRLTIGQDNSRSGMTAQTLTLKQTLMPSANSQLTFKSSSVALENVKAVIEVSPDDGASWNTIYTEPTTDADYSDRSASLDSFAGQILRLRLRADSAGTGAWTCCSGEGWYVDDIAIRNVLAADAPSISPVSTSTAFELTPSEQAQYNLEVRAQFSGSGFGAWSPVTRLSSSDVH